MGRPEGGEVRGVAGPMGEIDACGEGAVVAGYMSMVVLTCDYGLHHVGFGIDLACLPSCLVSDTGHVQKAR